MHRYLDDHAFDFRFPTILIVHFPQGVSCKRCWLDFNFTADSGQYVVTQIVQYLNRKRHFILWSYSYQGRFCKLRSSMYIHVYSYVYIIFIYIIVYLRQSLMLLIKLMSEFSSWCKVLIITDHKGKYTTPRC